jgi:hypothetical protein
MRTVSSGRAAKRVLRCCSGRGGMGEAASMERAPRARAAPVAAVAFRKSRRRMSSDIITSRVVSEADRVRGAGGRRREEDAGARRVAGPADAVSVALAPRAAKAPGVRLLARGPTRTRRSRRRRERPPRPRSPGPARVRASVSGTWFSSRAAPDLDGTGHRSGEAVKVAPAPARRARHRPGRTPRRSAGPGAPGARGRVGGPGPRAGRHPAAPPHCRPRPAPDPGEIQGRVAPETIPEATDPGATEPGTLPRAAPPGGPRPGLRRGRRRSAG